MGNGAIDSTLDWQHSGCVALNIKRPEPVTHLYRGAPAVRSWSKYQHTIMDWTLCGVFHHKGAIPALNAVSLAGAVSCPFCLWIMEPEAKGHAKNGTLAAEQDDGKVPW